ncbi:MAG: helix-turn-helix domain-containing protein [Candidatus Woesearchaeota archaeon]
MDLIEKLKLAGLSGNEARVYLELVKHGSIPARDIAKSLSMDRTLAYQILHNLIDKGFAHYQKRGAKTYYSASKPGFVLTKFREQATEIESAIPELTALSKTAPSAAPSSEIYEGKQGLRVLISELFSAKDICIFGATGNSYDVLKWELGHVVKSFELAKITGRMIMDEKLRGHKMMYIKGLKVRCFKNTPASATTAIYNDTVAIHSITDKPTVIIIRNKEVAQTYKNYFEQLWRQAKA